MKNDLSGVAGKEQQKKWFQCGYTTIALETANVFQSCPSHDRNLTHVSLPGAHTPG
ncbi:hypothetical protein [Prolixibacter sp. NT017]|uniref:hypothetical protein n=1 Tax=Prolixibacter sp. NT017 TaxID=2652390 RepID=UPI0012994BE3|nr:hypothetical protein [Prolixibacter sp. NT017]